MGLWLVIGLGALQGLTEFLPVSSSGHLKLLAALFGVEDPQTLFDILLHVGSLAAVFVVYRATFVKMLVGTWRLLRKPNRESWHAEPFARLAIFACIATVPTGLIAIIAGDTMESLAGRTVVVGGALIVNGFILLFLGRLFAKQKASTTPGRKIEDLTLPDALLIGTIQGMGIFRGISRSGSTITAGLLTGLDQAAAATFSFVLSVPAILGALVLKFDGAALTEPGKPGLYVLGALVSALVGTIALVLVLRLLDRGRLHLFAWYCFAMGLIAITVDLI